jgi:HAMP domain-containing protein
MQTLYTGEEGERFFAAFTKLTFGNAAVITSVEWNRVFEGVAATTRRNLFLTAAVLFLAVLLILIFSKTISLPILRLAHAARQIEGGEFETNIAPHTRDEVGELTESFGRMSGALEIFGRFTNREIALRAMRGEIRPGGLPRLGTMLFTDIRSFTETSETFTKKFGDDAPDYIVRWLNVYFERMVECVEETGGIVDKFIGDALMAHWGTASSSGSAEEDALNSVRAALLMREGLSGPQFFPYLRYKTGVPAQGTAFSFQPGVPAAVYIIYPDNQVKVYGIRVFRLFKVIRQAQGVFVRVLIDTVVKNDEFRPGNDEGRFAVEPPGFHEFFVNPGYVGKKPDGHIGVHGGLVFDEDHQFVIDGKG